MIPDPLLPQSTPTPFTELGLITQEHALAILRSEHDGPMPAVCSFCRELEENGWLYREPVRFGTGPLVVLDPAEMRG